MLYQAYPTAAPLPPQMILVLQRILQVSSVSAHPDSGANALATFKSGGQTRVLAIKSVLEALHQKALDVLGVIVKTTNSQLLPNAQALAGLTLQAIKSSAFANTPYTVS